MIECIRKGASLLFQRLGLRDFARIDGWFLPPPVHLSASLKMGEKFGRAKSGTVIFTDINLVRYVPVLFFQDSCAAMFYHLPPF